MEENLKGDKKQKTKHFWYAKFEYLNKKFYQVTNSKQKNKYYLDWEHSRFYNEIVKKKYENTADINNEIKNNLKFKDEINRYLNNNPTIRYKEFK